MTNAIEAGSSVSGVAVITNGSTNTIRMVVTGADFRLSVTNGAGKLYDLTPLRPSRYFMRVRVDISPGEQKTENIEVAFGTNIEPGLYTLLATRSFSPSDGSYELESNPLKIQIK